MDDLDWNAMATVLPGGGQQTFPGAGMPSFDAPLGEAVQTIMSRGGGRGYQITSSAGSFRHEQIDALAARDDYPFRES